MRLDLEEIDTFSLSGAMLVAKRIETFWERRGLPGVMAWVEPMSEIESDKKTKAYVVRSNLVAKIK